MMTKLPSERLVILIEAKDLPPFTHAIDMESTIPVARLESPASPASRPALRLASLG
jgi:hypothetical protein